MSLCWTTVGDPPRPALVPVDMLSDAVEMLADQFRREGLSGDALDLAVREQLPAFLDWMLFGSGAKLH